MNLIFAGALGMALCAVPASAIAQETDDECAVLGSLAQSIMEGRQAGAEMSSMLSAMESVPDNPFADLAILLAIEAFGRSQYFTDEDKARAIADFRGEAELVC